MSLSLVFWLIWPDQPQEIVQTKPSPTPGPQPTHTVSYVQVTGLSQSRLAAGAAQVWSADAQLVGAGASWSQLINIEQLGTPNEWSYRFYSPGKARLLNVKVQPDGQLTSFEHLEQITLPPVTLPMVDWVVDSPAALAIWLDYGGADLVRRNPGLEVLIQLRHLNQYPNLVWVVIGSDPRSQKTYMVVVDAKESKVVSTTPGM
jgi:hypothetical protein